MDKTSLTNCNIKNGKAQTYFPRLVLKGCGCLKKSIQRRPLGVGLKVKTFSPLNLHPEPSLMFWYFFFYPKWITDWFQGNEIKPHSIHLWNLTQQSRVVSRSAGSNMGSCTTFFLSEIFYLKLSVVSVNTVVSYFPNKISTGNICGDSLSSMSHSNWMVN